MLSDFKLILNRTDCTDALATTFLQQGISRVQRDVRLPSMERSLIIQPATSMSFFTAPRDLLQPIDLIWTDLSGTAHSLDKLSYRQLIQRSTGGNPCVYARLQSQFWIAGAAVAGTTLQFFYYGNFTSFTSADDDNELSASSPELAVYCALSYAGEHFEHPATDRWEAKYQAIKAEVTAMAIDIDANGGGQIMQSTVHWGD